jgi:hypothetical protein
MTESSASIQPGQIKTRSAYFFGAAFTLTVMVLIMGVMINRKAMDPEALANFRYMRELNLVEVWTGETFPGHFVTYRPMMATLLRLEYLVFGFNPPAYFAVNQVLLAAVALLLYDIIYRATREMLTALLGTLFFLTDWQIVQTLYVIGEVQITLAGLFGLWALWLVWFGKQESRFKPAAVFLLLLASALSKEFGLAFALAVFIYALYRREGRWKTYLILSTAAVIAFIALRYLAVPGSPTGREYSSFQNMVKWFSVNIGSGFLFTFVNLFRPASDGDLPSLATLRFSTVQAWSMLILQIIPLIVLFILGFKEKDLRRFTIPLLFLLLGNSLLFFFNYAFRFHFLGKIGMYGVVGIGISELYRKWIANPRRLNTLIVVFMYFAAVLFWRGEIFHQYLVTHRHWTENGQLCIPTEAYYQQQDFFGYYTATDPGTVRMVMEYYQLPIETCDCLDPYSVCK